MTAQVGSLTVPVAAGAALSRIADPTCDLLLAYLAHQLKVNLDAKLAVLTPTSADACPVANRFPWDPASTWVHQAKPALFVWETEARRRPWTLVWDALDRDIEALYVFDDLQRPDGITARAGLMSAVGKVLALAAERNRHATFSWQGGAPGACVSDAGNWLGWFFERGGLVWLDAIPGGSSREGGSGTERVKQTAVLGYRARFTVTEKIGHDEPEEIMGDCLTVIEGNDDGSTETIEIMQRYLTGPDGSEQDDG